MAIDESRKLMENNGTLEADITQGGCMKIEELNRYFEGNQERITKEWIELLSIPSISADPAYDHECKKCAGWVSDHLKRIGFNVDLIQTETKPIVLAERPGVKGKPTVLFYGHYDVQPVDPLELWKSEPFKPEIRDGRMYARGAEDNKGQFFYFLKAVEALIESGTELPNLKLVIEGEEESGGEAIAAALPSLSERIKADYLLVTDVGMLARGLPTVTIGLRGIAALEFKISGAHHDLHSGTFGGGVLNPAIVTARLVASLHDDNGKVAVPGFYDGVVEVTEAERKHLDPPPFDLSILENQIGAKLNGGERGITPLERMALRPTLEVNGMGSGYQGPGGKTIIPSSATVKLTMRLVEKQEPKKVVEAVVAHLRSRIPDGMKFEIVESAAPGGAMRGGVSSPGIVKAVEAIKKCFGRDPVLHWLGGSIPIIPDMAKASGADAVMVGFGLEEDRIHAPNESFGLDQFKDGFLFCGEFLSSL